MIKSVGNKETYKTVLYPTGDLLESAITFVENERVILAMAALSHCMKKETLKLYQKNKAR